MITKMTDKKMLYGSISFLVGCFIFSRLHFFLVPLPEIQADSILYMTMFEAAFRKGKLPDFHVVQLGYPLICYIFPRLFGTVVSITFFQHFLTLIACIYLLYSVHSSFRYFTIPVALALCVFVLSGNNVWHDSSIMTESIYSSILLLLSGVIVRLFKYASIRYAFLVSLLLFFLLMLRPTGIFGSVYCILLACYFLWKKNKGVAIMLMGSYFTLVTLLSLYHYFLSEEFAPVSLSLSKSETHRHGSYDPAPQLLASSEFDEAPSLYKAYKHYYWIEESRVFEQMYMIPHLKYFQWDWPRHLLLGYPDSASTNKVPITIRTSEWEKKAAFVEYYDYDYVRPLEAKDKAFRNSIAFKLYDLYQLKIASSLFRNILWVYLLLTAFFCSLIFIFFVKPVKIEFLWLSGICLLNIGNNSMHIITNHRTLSRYEYPGEAIIYVIGFVFMTMILRWVYIILISNIYSRGDNC